LPNLDYKIVVGNSLLSKFEDEVINIDWEIHMGMAVAKTKDIILDQEKKLYSLQHNQHLYFNQTTGNKKKLQREIRDIKIDILINQITLSKISFSENNSKLGGLIPTPKEIQKNFENKLVEEGFKNTIQKLRTIKEDINAVFYFFDWKLDFPEVMNEKVVKGKIGFDIVIGNPPYIQLQKLGKYADELQSKEFETFARTGDIYCLFYEQGINLLHEKGILTYITSNKWMRAAYGEKIRNYFINNTNPLILIDFGGYQVFKTATVDTNILVIQKNLFQNQINTCILGKGFSLNNMSDYFRQHTTISTNFSASNSWVVLDEIGKQIKAKIEKLGIPLKDWDVQINYGIKTGFNEAFIISSEKRKELIEKCPEADSIIRPILKGKHIKKYGLLNHKESIIIIPCGWTNKNRGTTNPEVFFKKTYPAVYEHLTEKSLLPSKGKGLFERDDQGDYWWELRPCVYLNEFEKEKMLYIDIMTDNEREGYPFPCFSYAKNGEFTLNTAYFMVGNNDDLKYILGLLNSKVGKFIVKSNVTPLQKRQYRMFQQFVDKFSIPIPSKEHKNKIIALVDEIIIRKTEELDTTNQEMEVNLLVNEICDFTGIEAEIIMSQE
jgi:hypothetical protein